jgi:hypothetical protein
MAFANTMNNSDENVKKIIRLMQMDDSTDAPEDAVEWSKNLFRTRAFEPKKSVVEKIRAVLKLDLSANRPVFGERSASAGQGRQMLFEAGENGVDLRISEGENGLTVRGQILGEDFAGAAVRFGDLTAETNELGEFRFENLPAGTYDLTIRTAEREIVLEEIEL